MVLPAKYPNTQLFPFPHYSKRTPKVLPWPGQESPPLQLRNDWMGVSPGNFPTGSKCFEKTVANYGKLPFLVGKPWQITIFPGETQLYWAMFNYVRNYQETIMFDSRKI